MVKCGTKCGIRRGNKVLSCYTRHKGVGKGKTFKYWRTVKGKTHTRHHKATTKNWNKYKVAWVQKHASTAKRHNVVLTKTKSGWKWGTIA